MGLAHTHTHTYESKCTITGSHCIHTHTHTQTSARTCAPPLLQPRPLHCPRLCDHTGFSTTFVPAAVTVQAPHVLPTGPQRQQGFSRLLARPSFSEGTRLQNFLVVTRTSWANAGCNEPTRLDDTLPACDAGGGGKHRRKAIRNIQVGITCHVSTFSRHTRRKRQPNTQHSTSIM